jgi:hypothetical protein
MKEQTDKQKTRQMDRYKNQLCVVVKKGHQFIGVLIPNNEMGIVMHAEK